MPHAPRRLVIFPREREMVRNACYTISRNKIVEMSIASPDAGLAMTQCLGLAKGLEVSVTHGLKVNHGQPNYHDPHRPYSINL
jgi:hypothetical protein